MRYLPTICVLISGSAFAQQPKAVIPGITPFHDGEISIGYDNVESIEFGQGKASVEVKNVSSDSEYFDLTVFVLNKSLIAVWVGHFKGFVGAGEKETENLAFAPSVPLALQFVPSAQQMDLNPAWVVVRSAKEIEVLAPHAQTLFDNPLDRPAY